MTYRYFFKFFYRFSKTGFFGSEHIFTIKLFRVSYILINAETLSENIDNVTAVSNTVIMLC